MTRPGTRIRTIAQRLFSAQTMERLIEPAIADLQHEYAQAAAARRTTALALLAGYWGLLKLLVRALDVRDAGRGPAAAAGATLAFTVLLVALPLVRLSRVLATRAGGSIAELALCLVPQALAISVPAGLFAAILGAWRDPVVRLRNRRIIVSLAVVASLATLANGQWIAPAANQEFREIVAGRPLLRGAAELPLTELRQRTRTGDDDHDAPARVAGMLHTWLAFAAAPLVIAGFLLSAATIRRRVLRRSITAATVIVFVGYYALLPAPVHAWMFRTLTAPAVAWLPDAFVIAAAFVIVAARRQVAVPRAH